MAPADMAASTAVSSSGTEIYTLSLHDALPICQLLARKLPLLVDAGIKRINVSLDTLDADAFRSIARGGDQ